MPKINSRAKGARLENELCRILSDHFGERISRKLGQARDAGNDIDLHPFRIESKGRKRIALLYDAMRQCAHNAPIGAIPVVALRADGEAWLITMRLTDWLTIAREEISK